MLEGKKPHPLQVPKTESLDRAGGDSGVGVDCVCIRFNMKRHRYKSKRLIQDK